MKRLIGWLLAAATISCMAGTAGAQQGAYALPHVETIALSSKHHNATFPNGKDSLGFWLETGTKQLVANYDTTTATDTLTSIPLTTNWGMFRYPTGLIATGDTTFLGRLTLVVDAVAGRLTVSGTDSVVVFTDVSPDGFNFIQNNVSTGITSANTIGNNEARFTFMKQVWLLQSATVFDGVLSTQTKCDCMGARALRFRLAMPSTQAKVKIKSATWTFDSTSPQKEK